MTKPVWSHVLASTAWTLKKAHIVNSFIARKPEPDCKYLHASQIPHNKAFATKPYLTV